MQFPIRLFLIDDKPCCQCVATWANSEIVGVIAWCQTIAELNYIPGNGMDQRIKTCELADSDEMIAIESYYGNRHDIDHASAQCKAYVIGQ